MRTLIIIRGLPKSGKTTLSRYIAWSWQIFDVGNKSRDRILTNRLKNTWINKLFFNTIVIVGDFVTESEFWEYTEIANNFNMRVIHIIVENRHNNTTIGNKRIEQMKELFQIML